MLFNRNKERRGFYASHLDEYIQEIKSGKRSYLPYVFCVFSERHTPSQLEAAKFLCAELKRNSFDEIIKIDIQMREKTSMEWFVDWAKMDPKDFLLPAMSEDEKKAVLAISSFHPNGYLREKAVKLLVGYSHSLPYLLLRMNDWVDQVRVAAQKALTGRLENLSEGELLASLPFAEKLNRSRRASHELYIERLQQVLLHPQNKRELELGLSADNYYTRMWCVTALLNAAPPNIANILLYLRKERVPHIRWITYKKLLACAVVDINEILEKMILDNYARIRNGALQFMDERGSENAYEIAHRLLSDDNASVRGMARWIIKKHKASYDFRAFYRKGLETKIYASICGLGETGTADDVEMLLPFLAHENERFIRAAMRSLMALASDRFVEQMVRMLDDGRIGIIKEAFTQLSAVVFYRFADEIHEIFQRTSSLYSRKKCIMLLFRCTKWESIIYMLEALSDSDEEIREYAQVVISTWIGGFNRSFTTPSDQQRQRIKKLIAASDEQLGVKTAESLLFYIR